MPTTPNTLYKRPMSEKYELPHTAREIKHNPISQSSLLWILKLLSTCCDIKTTFKSWQARRESNPQPAVLETAALPIELLAYSIILVTTPAPTVLPPSLIANFMPSSIAMGEISSTVTETSSPGMTISTPSGKVTAPVTSVVLT